MSKRRRPPRPTAKKRLDVPKSKTVIAPEEVPQATLAEESSSEPPIAVPATIQKSDNKKYFWDNFIRALEAEPVEKQPIKGASGLFHPMTALGIDRERKRIILISSDPDGRSAALVQADVQTANPDHKIIVARPISINLPKFAQTLQSIAGRPEIIQRDLTRLKAITNGSASPNEFSPIVKRRIDYLVKYGIIPALQALSYAPLSVTATVQDVLLQLSHVQFIRLPEANEDKISEADVDSPILKFGSLIGLDPAQTDREMGICSVPLYEFNGEEAEIVCSGQDFGIIKSIFQDHNILQYFFPPPDMLALGLIDRQKLNQDQLKAAIVQSPDVGHPLGENEFIHNGEVNELIDALKDKGFAVEGEYSLELTDQGLSTRATVKYKPREGFVEKLSRIISFKIDLSLSDLLGGGKK